MYIKFLRIYYYLLIFFIIFFIIERIDFFIIKSYDNSFCSNNSNNTIQYIQCLKI